MTGIKYTCHRCGAKMALRFARYGDSALCKSCNERFTFDGVGNIISRANHQIYQPYDAQSSYERNIIKWHFVTDNNGEATGLRGWDSRREVRYEMHRMGLNETGMEQWTLCVVQEFHGEAHYPEITIGSLFWCMRQAEQHADEHYAYETEWHEPDDK